MGVEKLGLGMAGGFLRRGVGRSGYWGGGFGWAESPQKSSDTFSQIWDGIGASRTVLLLPVLRTCNQLQCQYSSTSHAKVF